MKQYYSVCTSWYIGSKTEFSLCPLLIPLTNGDNGQPHLDFLSTYMLNVTGKSDLLPDLVLLIHMNV